MICMEIRSRRYFLNKALEIYFDSPVCVFKLKKRFSFPSAVCMKIKKKVPFGTKNKKSWQFFALFSVMEQRLKIL